MTNKDETRSLSDDENEDHHAWSAVSGLAALSSSAYANHQQLGGYADLEHQYRQQDEMMSYQHQQQYNEYGHHEVQQHNNTQGRGQEEEAEEEDLQIEEDESIHSHDQRGFDQDDSSMEDNESFAQDENEPEMQRNNNLMQEELEEEVDGEELMGSVQRPDLQPRGKPGAMAKILASRTIQENIDELEHEREERAGGDEEERNMEETVASIPSPTPSDLEAEPEPTPTKPPCKKKKKRGSSSSSRSKAKMEDSLGPSLDDPVCDIADEAVPNNDGDMTLSDIKEANELLLTQGLLDFSAIGLKNAKERAQGMKKKQAEAERKEKAEQAKMAKAKKKRDSNNITVSSRSKMKRCSEEAKLGHPHRDRSETGLENCSFYDCLYPPVNTVEETEECVAAKVQEVQKKIDEVLSCDLKDAYSVALAQEIKQQTCYIRRNKFLLAFLRAEGFNAAKAALRIGRFLKIKLNLFGPEMLPRPITQDHLNEDDMKVLSAGMYYVNEVDCGGRLVAFFTLNRMQSLGFLHEKYANNIARVVFYQFMSALENNDQCDQAKGIVYVRFGLNSTLPLKAYRVLFSKVIKMEATALPIFLVAGHSFNNNVIDRSCLRFSKILLPKGILSRLNFHNATSAAGCCSVLSQYGIDTSALPISMSGEFRAKFYYNALEEMRQKESLASLEEKYKERSTNVNDDGDNSIQSLCEKTEDFEQPCLLDGIQAHFPSQLMEIIQSNSVPDAMWWSRDGTAFIIEKRKFISYILPEHFGGIKYNSFIRRLQRWKFERLSYEIREDLTLIEYQHQLFRRNSPHLVKDLDLTEAKFPNKLMKVINNNEASKSMWWTDDGKAFAIKMKQFSDDVLQNNFEGIKITSFLRLLRKWGFKRSSSAGVSSSVNDDVLVFRHDFFQKNSKLSQIRKEEWANANSDADLKKPKLLNRKSFPKKLYRILSSQSAEHAIWWQDDGTSFAIEKVEFARDVLSKEYGGVKFSSFKRNLQRWGFRWICNDGLKPNTSVYQHPSFLRDSPEEIDNWEINNSTM